VTKRNGDDTPDKPPVVESSVFYGCFSACLILAAVALFGWLVVMFIVRVL
jgi:hypothetical protein